MSYLLEILAKGLEGNVGEVLHRYFRLGAGKGLDELEGLCRHHADRPKLRYQLGLAYLGAMQPDNAAAHLVEACRLKPDSLSARLALAAAYDEMGDSQRALEQLQVANHTHPGAPAVLFAIGYCLERLSRGAEAAEYYRDAVAGKGDFVAARQRLAAVALVADDLPEAVEQYERLCQLNPGEVDHLATLAHLYYRCGRFGDAVATFEKAIAMEPDNWALMDDEVEALVRSGQVREAIERLYTLLENQGPFADLHLRLAGLLSHIGQDDEATEHYLAALQADPNYLEAKIGLGTHHLLNGRWTEAAEAFHRAAETNDHLLNCYVGMGVAQAVAGHRDDALNSFQLAAAVEPNSTLLLKEMARLQLKAAAAEEFEEALEVEQDLPAAEADLDGDDLLHLQLARHAEEVQEHPDYADVRYRYGVLLRAEGRLGEALEQFAKAVEINPTYVAAIIRLGITQQEIGKTDEAVETFTQALELRPEYADVHYRLALLHTDRRQLDEAVTEMERAAGLAPGNPRIRASLALAFQNMGLMDRAAATWRSLSQMHRQAGNRHGDAP